MPFRSRAQQGFMHAAATRGEISRGVVDEFDHATKGRFGKLPAHVEKKAAGGPVCEHCGGSGYSLGGEVEPEEYDQERSAEDRAMLATDEYSGRGFNDEADAGGRSNSFESYLAKRRAVRGRTRMEA